MKGEMVETTVGRIIFSEILPPGIDFKNQTMGKKDLEATVHECFYKLGNMVTARFLDNLKRLGFTYATQAGVTVGIDDLVIPQEKKSIVATAQASVDKIVRDYNKKDITDSERYNKVIDTWTHATGEVERATFEELSQDRDGFNPIYLMADSGARGSKEQIRQLAGMRGLMAKPQKKLTGGLGEIIESPVIRNFKEGLSVLEYFISTHGARKGLADTALKTADAGYLTRRLVDVAQDVIITGRDCGTIRGLDSHRASRKARRSSSRLSDRILGRVAANDIIDPVTGEVLASSMNGDLIDEECAKAVEEANIDRAEIRSVLTCESKAGVCAYCYGRNLANGSVGRSRRGGRCHWCAVHRRAGNAADAAYVPHRWYGQSYRRAGADQGDDRGQAQVLEPGVRYCCRRSDAGRYRP